MKHRIISAFIALAALSTAVIAPPAIAAGKRGQNKADLATTLEGIWFGEIATGSARSLSTVVLTIERVGPNIIKITSDSKRAPEVTVPLQQGPGAQITARLGDTIIFYEPTRNPPTLEVTFRGDIAWRGTR